MRVAEATADQDQIPAIRRLDLLLACSTSCGGKHFIPDAQAIEALLCRNSFPATYLGMPLAHLTLARALWTSTERTGPFAWSSLVVAPRTGYLAAILDRLVHF